ncbi:archease [Methanofollis formosanus]|uniref:Archease n=1 Tax=Methanofollis formosanus TaxID=299308 RepID=A0A8G1A0P3_9EURY|nr:archease [Methanofollis formosanus]QYZ78249.1 archease [Methanofollis formosanus]
MPFIEVPHQADVKVRVWADDCNALFAEAARAMFLVMYVAAEDRGVERSFTVSSDDLTSLMVDFLSELLFISEVDRVVFSSFEVTIDGTELRVRASGEPFDPARHLGGMEIKGVSYSGLGIVRDGEQFSSEILFDV